MIKKMFLCGVVMVAFTTGHGLSVAQDKASAPKPLVSREQIASDMEKYMKSAFEHNNFIGSVGVTLGGDPVFQRGYGPANLEHDIANAASTKFRIGSITKQFTAVAVMILQERGKLSVDDPIAKHLEDTPEAWSEVTIHHLLTHTGGVPSYTSMPDYEQKMMLPQSKKEMVDRFRDKPLDFEPGEKFRYSNSGYFLLGMIIESASGKTYDKFLRDAVFEPLKLDDTGYDRFGKVLPHRATGYNRGDGDFVHSPYLDMTQPYSAGALYSTVEDMAKWDKALRGRKLLSAEGYKKMWTPEKVNYAYGWLVETDEDGQQMSHGGGINGFASYFLRRPDDELSVTVFCNVLPSEPSKVASDLAAIALGKQVELPKEREFVDIDKQILESYQGKYQLPGQVLEVSFQGDKLTVGPEGQPKQTLLAESDTVFFVAGFAPKVTFVKNEDGKVIEAVVMRGNREMHAKRLE